MSDRLAGTMSETNRICLWRAGAAGEQAWCECEHLSKVIPEGNNSRKERGTHNEGVFRQKAALVLKAERRGRDGHVNTLGVNRSFPNRNDSQCERRCRMGPSCLWGGGVRGTTGGCSLPLGLCQQRLHGRVGAVGASQAVVWSLCRR